MDNGRDKFLEKYTDVAKLQFGGIGYFNGQNNAVFGAFRDSKDENYSARLQLGALLNQTTVNIPILLFALSLLCQSLNLSIPNLSLVQAHRADLTPSQGDTDLIYNYLGNKQTVGDIIWKGQASFKQWISQSEVKYSNLTLVGNLTAILCRAIDCRMRGYSALAIA